MAALGTAGIARGQVYRYPQMYSGGYSTPLAPPTFRPLWYGNLTPVYPPSINYPAFYPSTVNLAALSPAIVSTGIPYYRLPLVNAPVYSSPYLVGSSYNLGLEDNQYTNPQALNQNVQDTLNNYLLNNALLSNALNNSLLNNSLLNNFYNQTVAQTAGFMNQPLATYAPVQITPLYSPVLRTYDMGPEAGGSGGTATSKAKPAVRVGDDLQMEVVESWLTRKDKRNTAYIDVRVPANATLWFNGVKTDQTGRTRRFVSPPLPRGREYEYTVRASWEVNGKKVTQSRRVRVHAGDWVRLEWFVPSTQVAMGAVRSRGKSR
jgi:uncharacterized protein (TIGR03000 family)